ncbi:solute carrier family 35 member G1-like [Saccoglossus kowalevskii]|uniref:Solute carrier family 35 member G1-like n=1 Tax=Saccoglossus kowalevskii TaxID=10224 RepID=A0ABM0M201_SACKO|nr:PREDICTED: solute carrier family 35 member G1-like [Saccoglossus kowalevskii]
MTVDNYGALGLFNQQKEEQCVKSKTVAAVVFGLISGICHASSGLFTVLATSRQLSEFQIIFVSALIGTLFSFLVIKLRRLKLLIDDRLTTIILFVNAGTMFFGDSAYVFAVQLVPLGDTTAIINGCLPFLTALLSCVILKESLRVTDGVCSILNICGILLITCPSFIFDSRSGGPSNMLVGYGLTITSAVCYSLSPVLIRKVKDTNIFVVTFYHWTINSLLSCLMMFLVGTSNWQLSAETAGYLIAVVSFDILEVCLLYRGVQMEGAITIVLLANIDVVIMYIFDHFVLNKNIHVLEIIGATMIVVSSVVVAIMSSFFTVSRPCKQQSSDEECVNIERITEPTMTEKHKLVND